jgi:hypothetical protein
MHTEETMASLVNLALRLNQDFREFARFPIDAKATIRLADQVFEGEGKILSLKGAYVTVEHPIELNSSVTVTITDRRTSQVLADMKATVVSATEHGVGLRFD